MNRSRSSFSLILALSALLLSACSELERSSIHDVLDARDQAVSDRHISSFSILLLSTYQDQGKDKADVLAEMISLFNRFDRIKRQSKDRDIRILDDSYAQCEQTYVLKVLADGDWREMSQREQLSFRKTSSGWKISGGL